MPLQFDFTRIMRKSTCTKKNVTLEELGYKYKRMEKRRCSERSTMKIGDSSGEVRNTTMPCLKRC